MESIQTDARADVGQVHHHGIGNEIARSHALRLCLAEGVVRLALADTEISLAQLSGETVSLLRAVPDTPAIRCSPNEASLAYALTRLEGIGEDAVSHILLGALPHAFGVVDSPHIARIAQAGVDGSRVGQIVARGIGVGLQGAIPDTFGSNGVIVERGVARTLGSIGSASSSCIPV